MAEKCLGTHQPTRIGVLPDIFQCHWAALCCGCTPGLLLAQRLCRATVQQPSQRSCKSPPAKCTKLKQQLPLSSSLSFCLPFPLFLSLFLSFNLSPSFSFFLFCLLFLCAVCVSSALYVLCQSECAELKALLLTGDQAPSESGAGFWQAQSAVRRWLSWLSRARCAGVQPEDLPADSCGRFILEEYYRTLSECSAVRSLIVIHLDL